MNRDFTYCNGNHCTLKKSCFRYIKGLQIPDDAYDYWWMQDCGAEHAAYIKVKPNETKNEN